MRLRNSSLRPCCSPGVRSRHRRIWMPRAASAGRTPSRNTPAWRRVASRAAASVPRSTWLAICEPAPSTGKPATIRRVRPATRTMKNSSRFDAKMARKRTRSSSGIDLSSASSSTRSLNSTQLCSRSRYRSSGRCLALRASRPTAAAGTSAEADLAGSDRAATSSALTQRPLLARARLAVRPADARSDGAFGVSLRLMLDILPSPRIAANDQVRHGRAVTENRARWRGSLGPVRERRNWARAPGTGAGLGSWLAGLDGAHSQVSRGLGAARGTGAHLVPQVSGRGLSRRDDPQAGRGDLLARLLRQADDAEVDVGVRARAGAQHDAVGGHGIDLDGGVADLRVRGAAGVVGDDLGEAGERAGGG